MTLNQIEAFVHVAEHGSFSKAALVLGVAQPLLSRQVRTLETELRDTLLLRHGRGVSLTDAGQRMLEHGQDILQLVSQARADLQAQRHEPVGRVTLAMPPTQARLLTVPVVQHFQATFPRAELAITEGFSVHLTEWLLTGRCDLALIYNPEPVPNLDVLPLRRDELCLLSPARKAPKGPLSLAALAQLPLVLPQRGQIFRSLLETAALQAGVQLNVAWEVSSVPAILDLVAAGIGHAALDENAMRAYGQPGRIKLTRFGDTGLSSMLCMVTPANKRPTPLVKQLATTLVQMVRNPQRARN